MGPDYEWAPTNPRDGWALGREGPWVSMDPHGSSGWMGPGERWAFGWAVGIDGPAMMGHRHGWGPMAYGPSGWMGSGQGWILSINGPSKWISPVEWALMALEIDGPWARMTPWHGWPMGIVHGKVFIEMIVYHWEKP